MNKLYLIEEYAQANNIPIMESDGIDFLIGYIKKNNIESILEIGSAIGYSAIKMALVNNNIRITTIERDQERYNKAIDNINDFNLAHQITIINDDAFNIKINSKFDLIFIDAAKSQYVNFFEKYKNNLNKQGIIISDNMNFHGLVNETCIKSRNLRQLMRKLKNYIDYLNHNQEFETEFINVGDGIAISKRKVGGQWEKQNI